MPKSRRCKKRRRVVALVTGCVLVGLSLLFRNAIHNFVRGYADGESELLLRALDCDPPPDNLGEIRFAFDEFNGLSTDTLKTNGLPWKLTAAALVMDAHREGAPLTPESLRAILSRFGFFWPNEIANWTGDRPPPESETPLGLITGTVSRRVPKIELEVANLGCASCHGGRGYDQQGRPNNRGWLGQPNTSLNLAGYLEAIYDGLKACARDPEATLDAVKKLFPKVSEVELRTLRKHVIPIVQARIPVIEAAYDAPTPFPNGSPGVTNGVASLKFQLGLLAHGRAPAENGGTSIPDLGGTLLRSSLLYDGLYSVPGSPPFRAMNRSDVTEAHRRSLATMATFFLVPSTGVSPRRALDAREDMMDVMNFVADCEPPPFPGEIDRVRASQGREIYRRRCAECHGTYAEEGGRYRLVNLPNRLVDGAAIGTDPRRFEMIDDSLVSAIENSVYRKFISVRETGGYAGKALSGIWATAPYLHNGSVPTLWHLMHPEKRPARFLVGGHRLDFEKVGLAGRMGTDGVYRDEGEYQPWSEPVLYDTTTPGCSNSGHEREFEDLGELEKQCLLEFLKLL